MKLLLILGSDDTFNQISLYVKPLGFSIIRYRHVLKAMDNIEEIDPTGIIISAADFPRHWKTVVQFARSDHPKESFPIIILKGKNFPVDETSKAFYLGVSGIVSEDLNDYMEVDRLQSILSRYIPVDEKRKARRFPAAEWNRLGLIISHPVRGELITGEVKTISITGLSFKADKSSLVEDMALRTTLPDCSLRIGDTFLSPVCTIARTGRITSLEFESFPENEEKLLAAYLEDLPMREMKTKQLQKQGEDNAELAPAQAD